MAENNTARIFWIEPENNIQKSYDDLLADINALCEVPKYLKYDNYYELFVNLLSCMLTNEEYVLLDSDWSIDELNNLGLSNNNLEVKYQLPSHNFTSVDKLLIEIEKNVNWKLGFYTSGTTGRPKYISHDKIVLARNVKTDERFKSNVWGFCYNPTHFAGIQVFLQAIYNMNTIINLFHVDYNVSENAIRKYSITHISATPTYYRSLFPYLHGEYQLVKRLTFGGEMFDENIAKSLSRFFPNSKVTNVYASTELGSIFAGVGNKLKIPENISDKIRVSKDGELEVHKSLMGLANLNVDEWFSTGDLVNIEKDGTIEFISRKSEMINVGGYKVNPHEIEKLILEIPHVKDVIVYGRDNRITGKIIVADIIVDSQNNDISKIIQEFLKDKLQEWKIPRIIKVVENIDRTRSEKKVRK